MNVLITAGGTSEEIDNVRSITNTATGRLGSLVAEEFSCLSDTENIFYIYSENAIVPNCGKLSTIRIKSARDLSDKMTELLRNTQIDVIIHSMAVGDYFVRSVFTAQALEKTLSVTPDLTAALEQLSQVDRPEKIRSDLEEPLILLGQNPKIISLLRPLALDAVIVGFKLLSGVSRRELLQTAHKLLLKNGCDLVLANDSVEISEDKHAAILIDEKMNVFEYSTKKEIAHGIVEKVMLRLKK